MFSTGSSISPKFIFTHLLIFAALLPAAANAQSAVVAQVLSDGRIKFERVDDLVINDNRKVKIAPESQMRVEPSDAKSLERVETNRAGLLRGDGKGRIYRVNPDGSTDRVIPENYPLKMSIQPATSPIPLTVTIVKDKKSKDEAEIPAQNFYFYQADPDPDRAGLQFVLSARNFSGLADQLHVIEGFVASLPNSPVLGDLRRNLETRLTNAAASYDAGGPYTSLLDAQKVASTARKAFPADQGITRASEAVDHRINATLSAERALRGLAAIEDWSTFLTAYRNIEANSDSFPELQALHHIALEERTREYCRRARALIVRHKDAAALEQLAAAEKLDPNNPDIPKLADSTRMLAAASEAKQQADTLKRLPKDSPQDRLFRQALYTADRAIADHDFSRAEDAIKQAERENAEAPEVLLARASLLAARDELLQAIPLLDRYDSMVTDSADREKGDNVRNQVLYELRKRRENSKKEIDSALEQGDFQTVYKAANAGLQIDPDRPEYLYPAGISAAVLRKTKESKQHLDSYLLLSDSLAANETERKRAREILRLEVPKDQTAENGTPNWFSGRKLPPGIYYCPSSLAFQIPFENVSGYKFHMDFRWQGGRLLSIRSDFDDDKGREDYLNIVRRGGLGSHLADAGNFSFVYEDTLPVVRSVYLGAGPKSKVDASVFHVVRNDDKTYKLVDSTDYPRVVLPENPWVNLDVVNELMGPVATVVSGNSFFNPFIWDGIHYFTVTYDGQGRASSASEWNADNLVKFSWEGERLVEVAAFHKRDHEAYYRRSISYSGTNIASEDYKSEGHGGRIRYNYAKNTLASVKIEDGGVHDGKTWVVRFSE